MVEGETERMIRRIDMDLMQEHVRTDVLTGEYVISLDDINDCLLAEKTDSDKCRDCKWLDMTERKTIGCKCVCPRLTHEGTAAWKYPSTPACKKGFERKVE